MKSNLSLVGVMAGMFLSGSARSLKTAKTKESYDCDSNTLETIQDCYPRTKKETYTEFKPNPENENFRKKNLGVKKKRYKK